MFDLRSFASQYLGWCSAGAAARIGSLPCFGSGRDVWHGNVPRRVLHTLHLGAIAGNGRMFMLAGMIHDLRSADLSARLHKHGCYLLNRANPLIAYETRVFWL